MMRKWNLNYQKISQLSLINIYGKFLLLSDNAPEILIKAIGFLLTPLSTPVNAENNKPKGKMRNSLLKKPESNMQTLGRLCILTSKAQIDNITNNKGMFGMQQWNERGMEWTT